MSRHQVHSGVSNAAFGVGLGLLAASNTSAARQQAIDNVYRGAQATERYYQLTGEATDAGRQLVIERDNLQAHGIYPSWNKPDSFADTMALMVLGGFLGFIVSMFIALPFSNRVSAGLIIIFGPLVGSYLLAVVVPTAGQKRRPNR